MTTWGLWFSTEWLPSTCGWRFLLSTASRSSTGQTQAHTLSSELPGGTQGPLLPALKFPPLHQYKDTSIANTAPAYSQFWAPLRVWRLLNPHSESLVLLRTADGQQHQVASDSWAGAHNPALLTWCHLQGLGTIWASGWGGQDSCPLPPTSLQHRALHAWLGMWPWGHTPSSQPAAVLCTLPREWPISFSIKHQHIKQGRDRKGGLLHLRGGCKTRSLLRPTISLLHL